MIYSCLCFSWETEQKVKNYCYYFVVDKHPTEFCVGQYIPSTDFDSVMNHDTQFYCLIIFSDNT